MVLNQIIIKMIKIYKIQREVVPVSEGEINKNNDLETSNSQKILSIYVPDNFINLETEGLHCSPRNHKMECYLQIFLWQSQRMQL